MEKTIDIEKILTSKLGGMARLVPRCLINWLRKIAHEDQVNQFLYDHRDEVGTQWLTSTVEYLKMHITIEGEENLPSKDDGKLYTFVSNHPLGGQDGVALGSSIGRHYDGRFRYLVNDLLMNLPGLRPVCVGINKTGKQSRDFPRMVEAAFQGNDHIIMFPAGLNSRMTDGVIRGLPWKKTFVTKSVLYQRDIVPIHFSGRDSARVGRLLGQDRQTQPLADLRPVAIGQGLGPVGGGPGLCALRRQKKRQKNSQNKRQKKRIPPFYIKLWKNGRRDYPTHQQRGAAQRAYS